MASLSLRYEYRLEGDVNFSPWNKQITIVLLVNGLWEFVDKDILVTSDATLVLEHNTKYVKARGIILDGVKDRMIPHITRKYSPHKML